MNTKLYKTQMIRLLFTNESPDTNDGILRDLDLFADISGVHINFSKTKMVGKGIQNSKETVNHSRW